MHNKISALCVKKVLNVKSNLSIYNTFGSINRARGKTAALLAGVFVFASSLTFAASPSIDVTIMDGDKTIKTVSNYYTVSDILEENNIDITTKDIVSPDLSSIVADEQVIVIDRVNSVSVTNGAKKSNYSSNMISDFFDYGDFSFSALANEEKTAFSKFEDNANYDITKVVKTTVSVDEPIPYKTVAVESASVIEGTTQITNDGIDGVLTKKYDVYLCDGVEISRTEVSSEVTKDPVDKVITVGTKPDPGKPPKKYKRVITCTATAYDLSFQSCGKRPGDRGYGITASGTHAKYGTVAVDPRVIPLGTKMYIETTDGKIKYGYCTAEDTGGAIKGNKVDLFYPSYNDCMQFGRRSVKVYILE